MEHPGQDEVARRALCLGALVMRGKFESVAGTATPQMHVVHEELATQLSIWIADEGLIASQSTSEKLLISKGLGSWSRREDVNHSEMTSITIERHYALNWLCGYAEDWDSVPTETRPGPGGA